MSRLVMKFGGSSVRDVNCMRQAGRHVVREVNEGHRVAVVVSAMGGETDKLASLVEQVSGKDLKEADSVLAAGEQISSGLFALVLQDMGLNARSWLGWQIPVYTDEAYGRARIRSIEIRNFLSFLEGGEVGVVAGFQGVSAAGRIATIGRGGSDLSAVALAAVLEAKRCDIYTDVEGIYTANPAIVDKACRLSRITYEEMLEMSSLGAQVLQPRSVALAMNAHVRLRVRSTFGGDDLGTLVCGEEEERPMEEGVVSSVTYTTDTAKITLLGVSDRPGVAAGIFGPLGDAGINVDMIVQNISEDGNKTDVTFTVAESDLEGACRVLEGVRGQIGYERLIKTAAVAKVSIVGAGMRSHAGVAKTMFGTLGEKGINIEVISTSEIKLSVLISSEYTELAVRALHAAYGLEVR